MKQKILACLIIAVMMLSSLLMFVPWENETETDEKAEISTVTYANSDVVSLWVRRNGTDPYPFDDWDGANVTPAFGMNYFSTNVIQTSWSYNWTDINNTALFPVDCEIYVQIDATNASAASVANHALYDSRIKGAWIDDFPVSLVSPSNMSGMYTAIHANDVTLGYNLTLGIVVYNRNYYDQVPNAWPQLEDYIDIIHYWFYPNAYGLLYPQFAGYEDDFMTFRSWMPDKEYWLGIYLHWYNVDYYPTDYSYEQMSIGGKLIKLGYATRYTILENFWIQHHPETSMIVKDFINNELQQNYSTTWYWDSLTALSYTNGVASYPSFVTDIEAYHQVVSRDGYIFHSTKLQTFNVKSTSEPITDDFIIWNLRTGDYQYPYYDWLNGTAIYVLEPNQNYRILYFKTTPYAYYVDTVLDAPTHWDSQHVTIHGTITLNSSLIIEYCIVDFANDAWNNTMFDGIAPPYGISISPLNDASLRVYDSIIQPENRAFPYYFNRTEDGTNGTNGELNFIITRSIVACHTDRLDPTGEITLHDTTFFQIQPDGSTYNYLITFLAASRINRLDVQDSVFWNYDYGGAIGVFLLAYTLHTNPDKEFVFRDNLIVGGQYGLWIDMTLTDTPLTIEGLDSYPALAENDFFTTFRFDGLSDREVIIETETIFNWSVKASATAGTFVLYYTYLANGLYTLTVDENSTTIPVTTTSLLISYSSPWLTYRNNFTLELFSAAFDSVNTMENVMWVLIIFLIPIAMCQTIPKLGFVAGMPLSLLVFSGTDPSFFPYAIVGFMAIIVYLYRGD